jgi:hypothetical protein
LQIGGHGRVGSQFIMNRCGLPGITARLPPRHLEDQEWEVESLRRCRERHAGAGREVMLHALLPLAREARGLPSVSIRGAQ